MRLWVEIKNSTEFRGWCSVSLFVRLWVEIRNAYRSWYFKRVSLFVRLWVEILLAARVIRWLPCQPLREAVSWNIPRRIKKMSLCSSASSWGCELKCYNFCRKTSVRGQPLREAVSWNTIISQIVTGMICQPLREAVSWNEEYNKQRKEQSIVSLFVRLWVEMLRSWE